MSRRVHHWIAICCGFLVLFPVGILVAALPPDAGLIAKLERDCAEGKIQPAVCQQLLSALHSACSSAGSEHGDCMDLPDGAHPIRIILVCILVACVFCLALSSVVPLCGYCGARNNNRCCVTVYMGSVCWPY
ncbi:unnamed protein product [Prorocentrum cordatum]|uniref:Uncharacterized protein n=1 Tax=Prorocentrum cordatum TaxID=2364126 RepID=A0ABN9W5U7_9DINO|nr:unnamed protein product [Polarella glacialis]